MDTRKIHWMSKQNLCTIKLEERLGFRDFNSFSLPLLAKKVCKLMHDKTSLTLKGRYFLNFGLLDAPLKHKSSYV